jgi:hypothetical protein
MSGTVVGLEMEASYRVQTIVWNHTIPPDS